MGYIKREDWSIELQLHNLYTLSSRVGKVFPGKKLLSVKLKVLVLVKGLLCVCIPACSISLLVLRSYLKEEPKKVLLHPSVL